MPSNALESGAQILYASDGVRPDTTPAPLPEVTHVNWREASGHEAAVIAAAHLANRAAEASVLGGLLQ
jgi:hypothetical protein